MKTSFQNIGLARLCSWFGVPISLVLGDKVIMLDLSKWHKSNRYGFLTHRQKWHSLNRNAWHYETEIAGTNRTEITNNKRKASYQRLEQDVIYKHEMPDAINDKHSKRFVYVLPKFVLGDNEKLMLEIKELKGSRKVVLETRM
tara:strand:+ start:15191 stop:15619 length:429 start_codon:yes stop_codon:yes gene_type:complete